MIEKPVLDINGSDLYNDDQSFGEEEQLKNGKKPRGSRFRGVSRNGNQWQVL